MVERSVGFRHSKAVQIIIERILDVFGANHRIKASNFGEIEAVLFLFYVFVLVCFCFVT